MTALLYDHFSKGGQHTVRASGKIIVFLGFPRCTTQAGSENESERTALTQENKDNNQGGWAQEFRVHLRMMAPQMYQRVLVLLGFRLVLHQCSGTPAQSLTLLPDPTQITP
jgi:hypothetical protein